jgi:hypothetical protein
MRLSLKSLSYLKPSNAVQYDNSHYHALPVYYSLLLMCNGTILLLNILKQEATSRGIEMREISKYDLEAFRKEYELLSTSEDGKVKLFVSKKEATEPEINELYDVIIHINKLYRKQIGG